MTAGFIDANLIWIGNSASTVRPMLDAKYLPHYTLADYRRWKGDWELIEGIPYAMVPSPSFWHQRTAGKIFVQLEASLHDCPRCAVVYETDWIVSEDTVVRPDIMVLCDPIEGDYPTKPPRLIVEVLSPATETKDKGLKQVLYARQGVPHYCLVDPNERKLTWLKLTNQGYRPQTVEGTQVLHFDLGPCQAELAVHHLWA